MKLKDACSLEEKLMTNLDSVLKSREIADKGLYRQGYGLPSAHVQLWDLYCKFSRTPKNWCLQTVVVETPESPLDSSEIKPVSLKEINPEYLLEELMLKLQYFVIWWNSRLIGKAPDAWKEGRRRRGRQRICLDGITNAMDINLGKLQEMVGAGRPVVCHSMTGWLNNNTMVILCFFYWGTAYLTDFHSGLPFLHSQQAVN